ncbi:hypothetical protein ACFO0N_18980 [Halobium salinum]|uniref:DUF7312 domain-containing protein n=1 Tax=Halobium salinum TaxID=1364940 RepID=A0ABD5PH46_9EURY|nr:hypothetical protein [Halobium salinum]
MSDRSGRRRDGPSAGDGDGDGDGEGEEGEWRFGLDEVGEDAEPEREPREPLEPESVSVENAFFVLVGALATVLLFWALAMP